jgi:glycogen operon protein
MDEDGEPVIDDSFLILVNAADSGVEYTLPEPPNKNPWRQKLDTENVNDPFCKADVQDKVILGGRSVRVYCDAVEEAPKKRPAKTL